MSTAETCHSCLLSFEYKSNGHPRISWNGTSTPMRRHNRLPQQAVLILHHLLLYFAMRGCLCVADSVDLNGDIGLDSRCFGSPNEESGSVFPISYIIAVRSAEPPCVFAEIALQCSISVSVPCNRDYSLSLAIVGSNSGSLQRLEQQVECHQTHYSASFVVSNRLILSGR
jgi:hypothetical protein